MRITIFSQFYLKPLVKFLLKEGHEVLLNKIIPNTDIVINESLLTIYQLIKNLKIIKKYKIKIIHIILDIPPWRLSEKYQYNTFLWYIKELFYYHLYYYFHNYEIFSNILQIFKKKILNENPSNNNSLLRNNKRINSNFTSRTVRLNFFFMLYQKLNLNTYNKMVYLKIYRKLLKKSNLNLSISHFTKYLLKNYLKIKSKVWYLCVDTELLNKVQKSIENRYDAINVSRIVPHKHQLDFVEAAKKLDLNVIVIGPHVEKSIKLDCPHYPLPHEEAIKEIARSKIYVDPSSFEGFGLTPIEAIFLGKPVIASDNYIHREVLNKYPLYFETGNISELVKKMKIALYQNYEIDQNIANILKNKYSIESRGNEFIAYIKSIL